jgi:hypothetical protein
VAFTVTEIVVELDRLLDKPVTFTVAVPVVAVLLAVSVSVLVPALRMLEGRVLMAENSYRDVACLS